MRGPARVACCVLLSLVTCALGATDEVSLGEMRVVDTFTRSVDVNYSYTSDHGEQAVLLIRPTARDQMRSLQVEPMFQRVSRGEGTVTFTFRSTQQISISNVTAGLAAAGAGLQPPFFTRQFTVQWSFPTRTTAGPQPATGTGQATPVPEPEASPLDSPIARLRVARLRQAISTLAEQLGVAREQILRDRRLMLLMLRHMAVSQEEAAEADLEIAEEMSDYEPPDADDGGVIEVPEQPTEHPDEQRGPTIVPVLFIESIQARERGCYAFNFAYHIADATSVMPLTFDVLFKGSANQWVTQEPWVHRSPGRNYRGHGFVTVWIDSVDAPLSLGENPVRLRARGSDGSVLAESTIQPNFSWYKRYDRITFQNIVDYCAGPDAVLRQTVGVNEGPFSLAEYFHGRYDREPPVLIFRTAEDTYCRGMFLPHQGERGLQGVWLVDLTCFDAHGPYWVDGHVPADPAEEFLSRRSYDNAGLLTSGVLFDLDYWGVNCTPDQADIVVQVDGSGKHFLNTMNGCRMYY